ncbi:flagellar hook capping FlgD N-terminal domain-containing protein [Oscillospiraceae bacterium 50-58]
MPTGMDINYRSKANSTSSDFDAYVNRWEELEKEKALYEDKGTLSFTDMLGLMVAQFQNQSIDNQASTTDMMNQLVQMSSMQAMTEVSTQIKELTLANVMAYSASLVGQTVTIGVWNEQTKKLEEIVGVVEGAGTYNGDQVIYVGGKGYYLSDIMAVGKLPPPKDEKPGDGEDDKTDGTNNNTDGTGTDNNTNTDNTTGTDNNTDTEGGANSGADGGAAG